MYSPDYSVTSDGGRVAALFDLDGVIVDTEGHYTEFWQKIGEKCFSDSGFGNKIKGRTLENIFGTYFGGQTELQAEITSALDRFEHDMPYEYVPGVLEFIADLQRRNIPRAVVTSSNRKKMENVYARHPELKGMFDRIFTGEDFARSKPAPDCYLLGMKVCGTSPEDTFIFEDSFNGLESARSSGGHVIALATTNSRDAVAPYADMVIDDFSGLSPEDVILKAGKRQ